MLAPIWFLIVGAALASPPVLAETTRNILVVLSYDRLLPPEVIIVAADEAFDFVLRHRAELFPQLPIVHMSVLDEHLLLDVHLAGMTGIQVQLCLRSGPMPLPVVFITAKS